MGTGSDVVLDVLRSEGVVHVFGNPGSTELPLMDALAGVDDIAYVLALQEATAVGMADGYAQVTGRPAFLNLHTSAGLGNAIGNLTNAQANRTPLVVTAGQQDRRHIVTDPLLSGDLVGLARSVSKWSHEVRTGDELGTILRRAFADAASPPAGPVFVSLPMELLDADAAPAPPRSEVRRDAVAGGVRELAELLADTDPTKLAIVVGDEVGVDGVEPLVEVAEALGVRVFGSPLYGSRVFPGRHPQWMGMLTPAAAAIRATLQPFERVFLVGGQAFLVYPYTDGPALPSRTELLHLSPAGGDVGRSHAVRLGLVGHPAATLSVLRDLLAGRVDGARADAARAAVWADRQGAFAAYAGAATSKYDQTPIPPVAAAHALVAGLPTGTTVVDEAITTGGHVRGFHTSGRYAFCRGGGLGWGMPAALGASLGTAGGRVLCVVGDGSAMYSPQALWTAANQQLPVVFAVVNNRQYLILKNNLRQRGGPTVTRDRFVGMDIVDPPIDYIALAGSMGVEATLIEKAADIGDAVNHALEAGRPYLIEIPVAAP